MNVNVTGIFDRLLIACNFKTLKDLSLHFGYKTNWASNCRLKNNIPWDECLKVALDNQISIDYLIFGTDENKSTIDINELKTSITEGVFTAIQCEMIDLREDVKISTIANVITSEIVGNCDIKTNKEVKKVI